MQNEQLALSPPVNNLCITPPESAYYLDTPNKLSNSLQNNELKQKNDLEKLLNFLYNKGYAREGDKITDCGQFWLPFSCSKGHRIYRQKTCGQPFCPICSAQGSWRNKQRANRVKKVLFGFPAIGHFVFTLPKEISDKMPDSQQINDLYKLAWTVLKEVLDSEAAVIIMHFCGDRSEGLHLHFDCSYPLLHRSGDCSYPLGILDLARTAWTNGVNKIFKTGYLVMVGHYNFVNTVEQEQHLIRYITRSTLITDKFLNLPDDQKEYCIALTKKKSIRYFGKFVGKQKQQFLKDNLCLLAIEPADPGEDLERNVCPICKEKFKMTRTSDGHIVRPVRLDDIPLSQFVQYNGHTLIDREIDAFLRQKEKIRSDLAAARDRAKGLEDFDLINRVEEILFKGGDLNGKGL